jgi:acyl carrier protein
MNEKIRTILKENAHLTVNIDTLSDEQNLYDAGMSSHSTVNVMLALEDEFDVEFPARLLRRSVFSSIASICNAIKELSSSSTELAV